MLHTAIVSKISELFAKAQIEGATEQIRKDINELEETKRRLKDWGLWDKY